MTKATGGRGHKADSSQKHQIVSLSLHPEVLALLDEYKASTGLNRSDVVSMMVRRHVKLWPPKRNVSRETLLDV